MASVIIDNLDGHDANIILAVANLINDDVEMLWDADFVGIKNLLLAISSRYDFIVDQDGDREASKMIKVICDALENMEK